MSLSATCLKQNLFTTSGRSDFDQPDLPPSIFVTYRRLEWIVAPSACFLRNFNLQFEFELSSPVSLSRECSRSATLWLVLRRAEVFYTSEKKKCSRGSFCELQVHEEMKKYSSPNATWYKHLVSQICLNRCHVICLQLVCRCIGREPCILDTEQMISIFLPFCFTKIDSIFTRTLEFDWSRWKLDLFKFVFQLLLKSNVVLIVAVISCGYSVVFLKYIR